MHLKRHFAKVPGSSDNEMILETVHKSPDICLTAEENPRKPQLGDRLKKGLCDHRGMYGACFYVSLSFVRCCLQLWPLYSDDYKSGEALNCVFSYTWSNKLTMDFGINGIKWI